MATVDEVELLPDAEQHKLLSATLERVNRASNAARAAALQANAFAGAPLREIVKAEIERAKLPDGFVQPGHRPGRAVAAAPGRASSRSSRRSSRSTLPPSAFKWNTSDRVTMLTASGRRTIAVRVDKSRGDLRPPLAGRPAMLVFRNGEFELLAADVEPRPRRRLTYGLGRRLGVSRCEAGIGRSAIGSTSIVCTARPIGPCSSCRRVSASPTPCGFTHAPDSRHTHSPTGCRCSEIVTSALIPVACVKRNGLPTPLPKSAAAATREHGEIGFARDDRTAQPEPRDARAGLGPVALDDPHVVRAPVADVAPRRTNCVGGVAARRAAAARSAAMPTEPSCRPRRVRSRNTVARATSRSSSSSNAASIHCTLRPGRIVRTRIVSGTSGTGRSSSTVTRATKPAGPGIVLLAHVREQRARRAAVHRARIPRPAA